MDRCHWQFVERPLPPCIQLNYAYFGEALGKDVVRLVDEAPALRNLTLWSDVSAASLERFLIAQAAFHSRESGRITVRAAVLASLRSDRMLELVAAAGFALVRFSYL